jgi:tellurite resistance protein TerC
MNSVLRWALPASLILLLCLDFALAWRHRSLEKSSKHAWLFAGLYVGIAVIAGLLIPFWAPDWSRQVYFATWATEYSLSLDNLLVFYLLFKKLGVPSKSQELLLFIGVSGSYLMRSSALIFGVMLVDSLKFMFGVFGVFLFYTSYKIFTEKDSSWKEGRIHKRVANLHLSPSTVVILFILVTDIIFAIDSIPAAVGISTNLPLMLTATFFAIMGLRHLYFVVADAAAKIKYLSKGIALVLLLLGLKLVLETLSAYNIQKIFLIHIPVLSAKTTTIGIFAILIAATCLSIIKNRLSRSKL